MRVGYAGLVIALAMPVPAPVPRQAYPRLPPWLRTVPQAHRVRFNWNSGGSGPGLSRRVILSDGSVRVKGFGKRVCRMS